MGKFKAMDGRERASIETLFQHVRGSCGLWLQPSAYEKCQHPLAG